MSLQWFLILAKKKKVARLDKWAIIPDSKCLQSRSLLNEIFISVNFRFFYYNEGNLNDAYLKV